jgi:hypothetical protein
METVRSAGVIASGDSEGVNVRGGVNASGDSGDSGDVNASGDSRGINATDSPGDTDDEIAGVDADWADDNEPDRPGDADDELAITVVGASGGVVTRAGDDELEN